MGGLPGSGKFLKKRGVITIDELYKSGLMDQKEIEAGIGLLLKLRLARIKKENGKTLIEITGDYKALPTEEAFRKIANGHYKGLDKNILKNLLIRGLVKEEETTEWVVELTDSGRELIQREIPPISYIEKLTPDIIAKREWVKKEIRWYDVTSRLPKIHGGREHPLRYLIKIIREIFIEMGFREMRGPWVDIAFWNMDSMFIPQDHPAREIQDTFYLVKPPRGEIRDKELLKLVKAVQENGYDTGSKGWQQEWKISEAERTLLRTHTTAVTFRVLGKLLRKGKIKPPVKFFSIDRVFRNETIDWKHLAEFHQVEGFVVSENLTLRSLMGYIKEFYYKIGIKKLRFKPTYNPYTEPSMEIFAWHSDIGKWIEVGNSGLFRPETLRPYGVKTPVIAWGLAVERLGAIVYGIEDIRELVGPMTDIDWVRSYKLPKIEF